MMSRIIPLAVFVLLGILLAIGLSISETKSNIPSPLIGRQVPEFNLPSLREPGVTLSQADFRGAPYLINFWGSWCPTCAFEHPVITKLAKSGKLRIVGLNFRDEPADARAWLAQHGDPYDVIVVDHDGRVSIDFGVYAAPESFLIAPDGEVVYKQIGAMTQEAVDEVILPMIAEMEKDSS